MSGQQRFCHVTFCSVESLIKDDMAVLETSLFFKTPFFVKKEEKKILCVNTAPRTAPQFRPQFLYSFTGMIFRNCILVYLQMDDCRQMPVFKAVN